jgi:predicted PolB exonuclease-like 3'-5' exonuclease
MAASDSSAKTAFLVIDTETVPDGGLVAAVKYPGEKLTPEAAIERAQAEARAACEAANKKISYFLPLTYQIPIAACVVRVAGDFTLQAMACLDAPEFRSPEIVKIFWQGIAHYHRAKLVTFNGRRFDMPLLELAAFRHGIPARDYFQSSRNRFNGPIDLCDWLSNFGACYLEGGLNLLAKLIGLPGKNEMTGEQVYPAFRAGKFQEINDYCLCDTLDTYFVFLRTRVLTGDIAPEREEELVARARELLEAKVGEFPVLRKYLDAWAAPAKDP